MSLCDGDYAAAINVIRARIFAIRAFFVRKHKNLC